MKVNQVGKLRFRVCVRLKSKASLTTFKKKSISLPLRFFSNYSIIEVNNFSSEIPVLFSSVVYGLMERFHILKP